MPNYAVARIEEVQWLCWQQNVREIEAWLGVKVSLWYEDGEVCASFKHGVDEEQHKVCPGEVIVLLQEEVVCIYDWAHFSENYFFGGNA